VSAGMPREVFDWNPIRVAEELAAGERFAYCPFAYSYGNYCRPGFAAHPLVYGELVDLDDRTPLRSVVGGTGIAISARCAERELALDYACFTASAPVQRGIYALAGGQPARLEAWLDPDLDAVCGGFFSGARRDQERCIVRPRYDGYVPLQEDAGKPLGAHLRGELRADEALDAVDAAYRASLPPGDAVPPL